MHSFGLQLPEEAEIAMYAKVWAECFLK